MCISTNITMMIPMTTITTIIATNHYNLHLAIAGNFAPVSSQTASSTLSLF